MTHKLIDKVLPGLTTTMDAEAMFSLLSQELPRVFPGQTLERLTPVDVQYKPEVKCLILYQAKCRSQRNGRSTDELLCVRPLAADEPEPRVGPSSGGVELASPEGRREPAIYLKEPRIEIYFYPQDPVLSKLVEATNPSLVREELNAIFAEHGVRAQKVAVHRLGYTPQARAAFRYDVDMGPGIDGGRVLRQLVGKMHSQKQPGTTFANAWALSQVAADAIRIARPLGYSNALSLTFQEFLPGERLGSLVAAPSFLSFTQETGRSLAVLHSLSIPLSSRRTPRHEAEVVHRWGRVLMGAHPTLARRIDRLHKRLAAAIEEHAQATGPIHGDFHHSNVLADQGRIAFIDLDDLAWGDPYVDVGRLLASLRVPALRVFHDPAALSEAGEGFLEAYLAATSGDVRRARLFEAGSLLIAASSAFRIQRPGWEDQIAMLVEDAEKTFDASQNGKAKVLSTTPDRTAPVNDHLSRWAHDTVYMKASLDPSIRAAYDGQPVACRLIDVRKTKEVTRFRYRLSYERANQKNSVTLEGLVRSHGAALLRRLEALAAGLYGIPDAPTLPRPVGYLPQLSMLVLEPPGGGTRLSALIGSNELPAALATLGRSLAAMHRVTLNEVGSERTLREEISALGLGLNHLTAISPHLFGAAQHLLARAETDANQASFISSPVIRSLSPDSVVIQDGIIAFKNMSDLTSAHPSVDVGNFLARLAVQCIVTDNAAVFPEASERLSNAYIDASGFSEQDLAPWEVGALVREACVQAQKQRSQATVEALISFGLTRLKTI